MGDKILKDKVLCVRVKTSDLEEIKAMAEYLHVKPPDVVRMALNRFRKGYKSRAKKKVE